MIDDLLLADWISIGAAEELLAAVVPGGSRTTVPPSSSRSDTPITIGQYSRLVMDAFEISGGVLSRLTGLPRYAARDLAYHGVIQAELYPGASVSGAHALRILGRVLELRERGEL